jgi:2TM domain
MPICRKEEDKMKTYPYNSPEYLRVYKMAKERVEARIGFYWHLAAFLVVNAFLFTIYLVTSIQVGEMIYPWFVFPLAGWGIGIILHAFGVFLFPDTGIEQEHRIERELAKMGVNPPVMPPPPTEVKQPQWVAPPLSTTNQFYQPPTTVTAEKEEVLK